MRLAIACGVLSSSMLAMAMYVVAPSRAQSPRSISIALGGDVIFDGPISYALGARDASEDDAASYAELFRDLVPSLSRADLALVNLETPVAPRREAESHRWPTFAAPVAFLRALRTAGVDGVTVANNHAYDQGIEGLASTLEACRASELAVAGSRDAPITTLSIEGVRVAIVAGTEGTNGPPPRRPSRPRVTLLDEAYFESITAARRDAELVIAALHFVETSSRLPSGTMRRLTDRAARAGANVVVGHGPHRPTGLRVVDVEGRRVPIVDSLGNLVAGMRAPRHAEDDPVASVRDALVVTFTHELGGPAPRLTRVDAEVHWIDEGRGEHAPFLRPHAIHGPLAHVHDARCERSCRRRSASLEARATRWRTALQWP